MLSISKSIFVGLLFLFPTLLLAQGAPDVVVSQRSGITDILKAAEVVQSQEPDPVKASRLSFSTLNDETFKDFDGWLRFNVSNQDVKDSIFVIQDRANNNPIFRLYQKSVDADLWLPVSNNGHVRFPVNVFGKAVIVPKGTTRQFLLRFARNPYEKITFLAVIPFHLQYDGGKNHISIFLAIALTMIALYHFAIYLLSKVRMYIIHALYSILFVVFMVTTNPWLYYWVSSLFSIKLLFDINLISSVLVLGAYGQFVYVFLDAKARFPQLRKWHSGFLILTILSTLLIIYIQVRYDAFFISRDITVGFCLLSFTTITAFLFVAFRKNVRADYFLLIGSLVLWSSILFGIYILYKEFYTDIFLIIAYGTIVEILIFALGIGYKLQLESRARIDQQVKFNQELEEQVLQRTRQIQEQKEEIVTQNEELVVQSEELMTQRDQLESQNKVIETQNIQLSRYAENLEGIVAERTQEVEAQNKQITEFAFITAHNLRGPLARMKGLSSLFEYRLTTPTEQEMMLGALRISLEEMDEVVHNMQETLEMQQLEISDWETISLRKKLEHIVNGMPSEVVGSILLNVSDELILHTSPEYFEKVMKELLVNAVKFANPARDLKIRIAATATNGKTTIVIEDNGLGLDLSSYRDKLFKMYQRFHPHVPGKGTGLYLVKTLVTKLKGEISVRSVPLNATAFEIIF